MSNLSNEVIQNLIRDTQKYQQALDLKCGTSESREKIEESIKVFGSLKTKIEQTLHDLEESIKLLKSLDAGISQTINELYIELNVSNNEIDS